MSEFASGAIVMAIGVFLGALIALMGKAEPRKKPGEDRQNRSGASGD